MCSSTLFFIGLLLSYFFRQAVCQDVAPAASNEESWRIDHQKTFERHISCYYCTDCLPDLEVFLGHKLCRMCSDSNPQSWQIRDDCLACRKVELSFEGSGVVVMRQCLGTMVDDLHDCKMTLFKHSRGLTCECITPLCNSTTTTTARVYRILIVIPLLTARIWTLSVV